MIFYVEEFSLSSVETLLNGYIFMKIVSSDHIINTTKRHMTYIIVCYYSGVAESGSERVWVSILNPDKPRLVSAKTSFIHSRTL